jgi:lipoprotein-anchoring transpeptidase ErfK/SrfK
MKMMKVVAVGVLLCAVSCSKETAGNAADRVGNAAQKVANKVSEPFEAVVPIGRDETTQEERNRQRLDEQWRRLHSFQRPAPAAAAPPSPAPAPSGAAVPSIVFAAPGSPKESFKKLDSAAIGSAPVHVPIKGDVVGPSVLRAQVLLDRLDLSVGVLDGQWGKNSAISTWWFQRLSGLDPTGEVDQATFTRLAAATNNVPALVQYTVTADDARGPFVHLPDDVYEKAKLDCLCYETIGEELAEKFHTTQDFLNTVNPDLKLSEAAEGTRLWVPNVRPPLSDATPVTPDIAKIVVSISGNSFNAFDSSDHLVFHAPTTVGSKYDPSPNETVKVVSISQNPGFHYQPTLFHEVPDSDPEAQLRPGPNSPVGVVWIALSKEHFGIHGTSDPDSIGYASSHGCIRLTNWDAAEVSRRVTKGVPVEFVDTRHES